VDDYSSLGKQAISDAQPAGSDVRGEDDFDLLQTEIAKMSNPAASGAIDWQQVVRLAGPLLANKGKDILVASYLAGGLLQMRGLPGLLDGLQVLADMLETHWDTLYPPLARLRARRNALDWLLERVNAHADETDWSSLSPQEPPLIEGLRARAQAIDALLADKDSEAPSMRPLLTLIGNVPVMEIPAAALAPMPAGAVSQAGINRSASTASSSPSPAAAGTPLAALSDSALESPEHAEQAAGQALERLAAVAAWLGDNGTLAMPQAFRLNRLAAWGAIDTAPQATDGQTLLPDPNPQLQDALRNLVVTQADEDAIRFAEAQLPNYPFWLDLNRAAARAMERLGAGYDQARREVASHTAALTGRLPGIQELAFSGGTPFADGETLEWLQGLAGADAGGAPARPPDAGQAAFGNARALAASGDLAGAAAGLQKAMSQGASPGQRFKLRAQLCELLLAERPGANLDPFAHALLADVERHGLAAWDPPLALEGLLAAYKVLARNDEGKEATDALLAKITAIDAEAAVKLIT
jgi:type VI secretion system protein VasJ